MSPVLRLFAILSLSLLPAIALPYGPVPEAGCPILEATDPESRQSLMHFVCFYSAAPGDPAHDAHSPDDLPENLNWRLASGHDLVFSHTKSVYWVRLNVENTGSRQALWYLKLNYPLLDEVTFWQTGDGPNTHLVTGDQRPFDARGIDYRYFLLPVTLAEGETRSITLRVRSSGALNVPLTFETPEEVIAKSNHLTLTHGLFYGALLVFAVFNLLLFFSSGTAYYFYNAFYMAAMGLFMFAMGGFANQYFWPDSTGFANTSIPLSLALCALSMTLFGRSFLEVERKTMAGTAMTALAWFCIGFLALTLLLPYSKTILLNTVLALSVIGSLFVIAVVRWRHGYQPAMWYVLAWLVMLLGGLIYALAAFGYLADFLAREALMQVAVGGQVVLLNYAMVQRWRLLNEKLLEVEHNARTELEFKVHERTAQLRNTMRELEKANRQLATLSLNDSLTGLHNRRHMDNILPELCAEARRTRQPLTLALVDADHFKTVNDTWGHAFGDTFLQLIADILTRHVKRPRDVAVRFGGEEFALLLPGTDIPGARKVCEAILHDIATTSLTSPDGHAAKITLSAGVASLAHGEDRTSLFDRADEALYRAKSRGRNRVVVSDHSFVDKA
ncbi:diguanylate cyclase [Marinobacter sp. M216]|uniref:diguanylate cyclase n=1 Tax=Marinobacter albus TaxID=3030833 RepID=A0ABT7HAZ8_9GAMM|nr:MULTISPECIES: diguanylate cyclase [unclassified Marinobacter]MBW7470185.1 diguanylate cyclase [Marinobacter sp. F4218]MDK9557551.1 diguanylate cyclase [Marinobacter sp. M216]